MTHTSRQIQLESWIPSNAGRQDPNSRTMAIVLMAAIGLGLIDLGLTGTMMTRCGMYEANPLARLVTSGGLLTLTIYKIAMMGVHSGLIWKLRNYRLARITAWASIFILGAVVVQWILYMEAIWGLDCRQMAQNEHWVQIGLFGRHDAG